MTKVRKPAVAGSFYPADPTELAELIASQLDAARATSGTDAGTVSRLGAPAAVIAPHAGYIYSGTTAALAYQLVREFADQYRRVVLLGPAHRVAIRGLATAAASSFATPLGDIPVEDLRDHEVSALPQVAENPEAHALEHALEVHLPFLQTVLADFILVPMVVGSASPQEVSAVIDALCTDVQTLLVVSSDLSHYLPHEQAKAVDTATVEQIVRLEGPLSHEQACGATPVNGLLLNARRRGQTARLLGMCTSGDTAGDRDRVVGYASVAFHAPVTHSGAR